MVERAEARQSAGSETGGAEADAAAPPIHLPGPSLWPAALGLGVALLLFGVLTHWAFSIVGAALFIYALGSWISQLRHESLEHETERATEHGQEHDAHT